MQVTSKALVVITDSRPILIRLVDVGVQNKL